MNDSVKIRDFFLKVVHGETEHRLWLKNEFENFWGLSLGLAVCPNCCGRGEVVKNINGIPRSFIFVGCLTCKETGFVPTTENTSETREPTTRDRETPD